MKLFGKAIMLLFTASSVCSYASELKKEYKQSSMTWNEKELVVSTGKMSRKWYWSGAGLVTDSLRSESGKDWVSLDNAIESEWFIESLIGKGAKAEVVSVSAEEGDDEGFTSKHLKVDVLIKYPAAKLLGKYTIWAYPGADGLRTALSLKGLEGYNASAFKKKKLNDRVDFLGVDVTDKDVKAIAYYSDTQNRNLPTTPIIKEEKVSGFKKIPWASVLKVDSENSSLYVVKESHKCPNTPHNGANTGSFVVSKNGIENTGLGLTPVEISSKRFHKCWATWTILAQGSQVEQNLTFKKFDRTRYPIDPKRDIYLMANTWGSTISAHDGRHAAREENLLAEIKSQADLGIDIQQIDDGWQGTHFRNWRPVAQNVYYGNTALKSQSKYTVYPDGWKNVKKAATDAGIRLGLWAAWNIPAADLIWNYDNGGFRSYKLDFAHLNNMTRVEELMGKARSLILHSKHNTRINWDVTEKSPRVGYFFGREYGNIYLENRKPVRPASVVYKPYLVLRDAWHISKYINLNKFQVTVQNVDRINRKVSDAWKHPHGYALAQTLMGCPIFFQETHYYTDAARKQLKPLIATYKKVRDEMFKGYVFPIGDEPDNKSWSGFQNHNTETGRGFVTILRQLNNKENEKALNLHFLAGKKISLKNLETGQKEVVEIGTNGELNAKISQPAGYLFMQYEVM